ncbi:catalase family peroxidase [Paenibacillus glucanolyticus]|uniref:catalase family peroxidase n=2 Tax=Paenibacillus glucanolyticus TaxID=59843 RepID=UPI0036C61AEE
MMTDAQSGRTHPVPDSAPSDITSQTVNALEDLSGVHPGYRRAHAKGFCCRASFRSSGLGAAFTTAPHMQEEAETPAIVRFSGVSTNPAMADLLSPAKGMAVQFTLPGGDVTYLVGATVPVFFARTPESFLDIMKTVNETREGERGPIDLIREIITHFSESKESLLAVKLLKPPASYAACHYYCIHAYLFLDSQGNARPVKFEWLPEGGVETLSIKDAAQQREDYLMDELRLRLETAPAVFQLDAIFGEAGDPTDDPTRAWPDDRKRVILGHLYVTDIIEEPEGLLMDPTVMAEGMALSDDPILHFRHSTYTDSYNRRSAGQ